MILPPSQVGSPGDKMPVLEPVRLQDLFNSACLPTEKSNKYFWQFFGEGTTETIKAWIICQLQLTCERRDFFSSEIKNNKNEEWPGISFLKMKF